jgi:hypothetical protein
VTFRGERRVSCSLRAIASHHPGERSGSSGRERRPVGVTPGHLSRRSSAVCQKTIAAMSIALAVCTTCRLHSSSAIPLPVWLLRPRH